MRNRRPLLALLPVYLISFYHIPLGIAQSQDLAREAKIRFALSYEERFESTYPLLGSLLLIVRRIWIIPVTAFRAVT